MKLFHLVVLAILAAVAVGKPHGHLHRRAHKIVPGDDRPERVVYEPVAIETVYKYILEGHEISEQDVRQGLANGTLVWGNDGVLSTSTTVPVAIATPPPAPSPKPVPSPKPETDTKPSEEQPQPPPLLPVQQPVDTTPKTPHDLVDKDGNCTSCDREFPNGQIPCFKFPYGYGAMPLHQEGLGGWSGIQDPAYRGSDGFDDIRTVVSGSCSDGSCCTPGTWCSYGCPNPYLKLSFPKMQGRTGQTIGGLYCNSNGMLEMADGSIGKTMCGKDSAHMAVKVQNRLSKSVSICRTDYPGTESMTFPLTLGPGESGYLANPDQAKYFFWQGRPTSAHYYINKQGVSEADGCTWSTPSEAKGNWAPAIFGTSYDDINANQGFSSLKQNELNKNAQLDYSITFTGEGVISPCSYNHKTDEYCENGNCWRDKDRGCTAAINQGSTLTLVLHDD